MESIVVSDDLEVLRAAVGWLAEGSGAVALVTVLRTWGSSPRPPGSLLVISARGDCVGSVSGGCVEETLSARHRAGELGGETPVLVDFGVERLEASRLGLPCGGRLELLVELLETPGQLAVILEHIEQQELVARHVEIESGESSLREPDDQVEFRVTESEIVKVFGPSWQLLLIGNGLLARHLAAMGLALDYRVTICDPRSEFVDPNPLPDVRYSSAMPDDEVTALGDASRTAIVTLAHDPRQDDLALSAALESNAFYLGSLGSRRTAASRRERLAGLGYVDSQLARIHGPAGLDIGSKRPGEIALSIMAGITAVRNGIGR